MYLCCALCYLFKNTNKLINYCAFWTKTTKQFDLLNCFCEFWRYMYLSFSGAFEFIESDRTDLVDLRSSTKWAIRSSNADLILLPMSLVNDGKVPKGFWLSVSPKESKSTKIHTIIRYLSVILTNHFNWKFTRLLIFNY